MKRDSKNLLEQTVREVYKQDPMFALMNDLKLIIEQNFNPKRPYQPSLILSQKVVQSLIKEEGLNINLEACDQLIEILLPYLATDRKFNPRMIEFKLINEHIITMKKTLPVSLNDTKMGVIPFNIPQPEPLKRFDNGKRLLNSLSTLYPQCNFQLIKEVNLLLFKPYARKYEFGELILMLE